MSGMDELKGRAKEAAGALTDDEDLKREGKMDQAADTVKDRVKDKVDDAVDDVKERLTKDD